MKVITQSILFIFLLCKFTVIFAQDTKTYSGDFKLKSYPGKCTYSYYENDNMERVRHGVFTFKADGKNVYNENVSVSISGKYEHGKPTGGWSFSLKTPHSNETVAGSFLNGEQTGSWSFKKSSQIGKENKSATLVYSKGNILDFKMNSTGDSWSNNYSLTGKADDKNRIIGSIKMDYKYQDINIKESREYQNGKLYKQVLIDNQTGRIIYNKSLDSTSIKTIILLESGTPPEDLGFALTNKKCELEDDWFNQTRVEPCALVDNLLYNSIIKEMQDLTFKEIGVCFLVKAKNRADLEKERLAAEELRNNNIKTKKNEALNGLKLNYSEYSSADLEEFAGNVAEIVISLSEVDYEYNKWLSKGVNQDRLLVYKKCQQVADTLWEDMNSTLDDNIADAIKKSVYLKSWLPLYKEYMKKELYSQDFITGLDKSHSEIEKEIKANREERARKKAEAKVEAEAKISKAKAEAKAEKDRIEAETKVKNELLAKIANLSDSNSEKEAKVMGLYVSGSKIKKKSLHYCLTTLSTHYKQKIIDEDDLNKKISLLLKIGNIYDRFIFLADQKTGDIEKQLKEIKLPSEMEKILGI